MKALFALAFALFIIVYAMHGVMTDHLYLPLKNNASMVLQGTPAKLMGVAAVAGALTLVMYAIEELDGRERGGRFRLIKWGSLVLGLTLSIIAKLI